MEQHFCEPTKKFPKQPPDETSARGFFSGVLLFLVSFYRAFLGPYFGGNCRFYPSCSHYAVHVLKTQSPSRAVWLIGKRLLKCHPFGKWGYDPAPDTAMRGKYER